MLINRRNLLRSMLAAPAVVAIDRLMPVKAWALPILWGDGIHDDTLALNALFCGDEIAHANPLKPMAWRMEAAGGKVTITLRGGRFSLSNTIHIRTDYSVIWRSEFFNAGNMPEGSDLIEVHSEGNILPHCTFRDAPRYAVYDKTGFIFPKE